MKTSTTWILHATFPFGESVLHGFEPLAVWTSLITSILIMLTVSGDLPRRLKTLPNVVVIWVLCVLTACVWIAGVYAIHNLGTVVASLLPTGGASNIRWG